MLTQPIGYACPLCGSKVLPADDSACPETGYYHDEECLECGWTPDDWKNDVGPADVRNVAHRFTESAFELLTDHAVEVVTAIGGLYTHDGGPIRRGAVVTILEECLTERGLVVEAR